MSTAPPIEDLQQRLAGRELPRGKVRLEPHEVWLGDEAMLAGHEQAQLSPTWVLVAALRGMGLTLDELVGLADSTTADGVLFGELGIEEFFPLEVERDYTVTGEIGGIARRNGRSGTFDILSFELSILDAAGDRHGAVSCSFILPRGRA
jgi:hypothetical protein